MKIGIDVRMIFPFQTGIGNYRKSLIKALFQIDAENEYLLIGNELHKEVVSELLSFENVSFRKIKSLANNPLQHILLRSELKRLDLDIFYTTHWGATLFMPCKYVLEIPDLIYHHYPQFGSWKSKLYELLLEKVVAKRADAIVTISDFVKHDIVEMLGVSEGQVTNIKGAVSEEYRVINDSKLIASVLKKYNLAVDNEGNVPYPYFVYLGNQRPHKNLVGLLKAFESFMSNPEMVDVRLAIIGGVDAKGRDQDAKRIQEQLSNMKFRKQVLLLGRVDKEPTAAIFNRAIALVHPSFHEGFGLTPLEAMSSGCPVISSNITSVPEVVGDAGILINPHDINEISQAMIKIYSDQAHRKDLSMKSLDRAKEFSWRRTAGMLKEVFDQTYSSK